MQRRAEHEDWQSGISPESWTHEDSWQRMQPDYQQTVQWDSGEEPRFSHHRDEQAFGESWNIHHHRDDGNRGSFASSRNKHSASHHDVDPCSSRGGDGPEPGRSLYRDPHLSGGRNGASDKDHFGRDLSRNDDDLHDSFDRNRSRPCEVSHDSFGHRNSRSGDESSRHSFSRSLEHPSHKPDRFRHRQPLRGHVDHETFRNADPARFYDPSPGYYPLRREDKDLYHERDHAFPEANPPTHFDYIRSHDFVRNPDLLPDYNFTRDPEVKVDSFRGEEWSQDYPSRICDQPANPNNSRSHNPSRHWDSSVRTHEPVGADKPKGSMGAEGLDSSNPHLSNPFSTLQKEPKNLSKSRFFVSAEDIKKFDSVDTEPMEHHVAFQHDVQGDGLSHESGVSNTKAPRELGTSRFYAGVESINKLDHAEGDPMEHDEAFERNVHYGQGDFVLQGRMTATDGFDHSRYHDDRILHLGDTSMLTAHQRPQTGIAAAFTPARRLEGLVPDSSDRRHGDRRMDSTSSAHAKPRQDDTVFPAFGQKRKNIQPLRGSAAKQAKPLLSLMDVDVGKSDLVNPALVEGLFDQEGESWPSAERKRDRNDDTVEKKLQRLTGHIIRSPYTNNATVIHNAIMSSHINMAISLEREEVANYNSNCKIVTIKVMLGNVFLARAVGLGKADVKRECYKMAIDVLTTKDAKEILTQVDIGLEGVRRIYSECEESMDGSSTNAIPMVTGMSYEQNWQAFIKLVKNLNAQNLDVVSRLEKALMNSDCGFKRHFTSVPINKGGRTAYEGNLVIGGTLLAQGQGYSTKEAKITTYELAYQRLITADLTDIMQGITPRDTDKAESESFIIDIKEINTVEMKGKFERFLKRVREYSLSEGPSAILSKAGVLYDIPVIIVHKHLLPSTEYSCEVFLGDVLAGNAQGSFKNAQKKALDKAYKNVLSTSMERLLTESRRMTREDVDGLDVVEVLVKGKKQRQTSNIIQLHQFHDIYDEFGEDWRKRMVVAETEVLDLESRKDRAVSILTKSANMSGVLMKCYSEASFTIWVVWVELQGEIVGMAKGHSLVDAKQLACADALFKLYETQPVLKILSNDPSSRWVTRAQLMKKMKEMPESDFADADTEWFNQFCMADVKEDGEKYTEEQKEEKRINAYLMKAASMMVSELKERRDCLEELVFAPEVYGLVQFSLSSSNAGEGLQFMHTKIDDEQYLSVHVQAGVHKIVHEMKKQGIMRSDRFELMHELQDLPHHADIAQELAASRALCRSSNRKEGGDSEDKDSMSWSAASLLPKKLKIKQAATRKEQLVARFAQALKEVGIGQTLVSSEKGAS